MDINNGYDRHLDPSDEPEAEYCEFCGKEMEDTAFQGHFGYTDYHPTCKNRFCPSKFESDDEVYSYLVEVEQELADTKLALKQMTNRASKWTAEFEKKVMEIAKLQAKPLKELTQSQSNVVVRDTDYQIRRMEDAIQVLYNGGFLMETAAGIQREWAEVKKILESYG